MTISLLDTWPREAVAARPNMAWCSVCRFLFASSEGFDVHRGIAPARPGNQRGEIKDDVAQDAGRCSVNLKPLTPLIITINLGGEDRPGFVYFTDGDLAVRERALKMLRAKEQGKE